MKKILGFLFILILASTTFAYADEITDSTITHTSEYYRQQVIIAEKYTKNNFIRAVATGNTKLVEAYVKSGMDPNSTQMKLPAIIIAIGANRPDVLQILINNGANIESKTMGLTPLLFAINQKNENCVKVLIDNKVDVNNPYKDITPLYTAVSKKHYEISKMLIAAGAEINDDTIVKAVKSGNKNLRNLVIKTFAEKI